MASKSNKDKEKKEPPQEMEASTLEDEGLEYGANDMPPDEREEEIWRKHKGKKDQREAA